MSDLIEYHGYKANYPVSNRLNAALADLDKLIGIKDD